MSSTAATTATTTTPVNSTSTADVDDDDEAMPSQMRLMKNHLKIYLATLNPPITTQDLTMDHFTQELCQGFATYLSKKAIRLDRKKPTPIRLQTCENYFSCLKGYYLRRFGRDHLLPPSMTPTNWASYLTMMVMNKKESLADGETLMTPRECASADDRKALGALCFWNSDVESAEFLLFLNVAYQIAGRGGEVASLNKSSLKIKSVEEDDDYTKPYEILRLDIYRPKTGKHSKASIFPDRNSVCLCLYFSLAYFLALSCHSSSYLLPTFGSKLVKRWMERLIRQKSPAYSPLLSRTCT